MTTLLSLYNYSTVRKKNQCAKTASSIHRFMQKKALRDRKRSIDELEAMAVSGTEGTVIE